MTVVAHPRPITTEEAALHAADLARTNRERHGMDPTDRGFIVFTEREGGELTVWWGRKGQFEKAVEDGFLTHTDWTREDAPTVETRFESIMWAPAEIIMRPVGPGGQLQETRG